MLALEKEVDKTTILKLIEAMPDRIDLRILLQKILSLNEVLAQLQQAKNGKEISTQEIEEHLEKTEEAPKPRRVFGSMKGVVVYMAPDFNAPLEEFNDYM